MNEMNYMAGNQETDNVGACAAQAVMAAGQTVQPFQDTVESASVATPQETKPYTLRDLNATDIFLMTKIIRKIGLKDIGQCFNPEEIKAITGALSENGEETNIDEIAETVGISIVLKIVDVVLENLSEAKQEIFDFLAGISGMTSDEVERLRMDVFVEMLVDIFRKKEFVGFMRVASKLLK